MPHDSGVSAAGQKSVRKPTGCVVGWSLVVAGLLAMVPILFIFLLAFMALANIARSFSVPTRSMSPTIMKGDGVYVDLVAYSGTAPRRGDVVVFWAKDIGYYEDKNEQSETFVKRLVGLPGETISLHSGHLWVNGLPAPELAAFNYEPAGTFLGSDGDSFTVPPDSFFVLGDNSHDSLDSRYWVAFRLGTFGDRQSFGIGHRCESD